jgi:hypothetical protein
LKGARAELDVVAKRIAIASSPSEATARQRTAFRVYRGGLDWRDEPSQALLTIGIFLFIPLSVLAIRVRERDPPCNSRGRCGEAG